MRNLRQTSINENNNDSNQKNQWKLAAFLACCLLGFDVVTGKPDPAPFVLLALCAALDGAVRAALFGKRNGGAA